MTGENEIDDIEGDVLAAMRSVESGNVDRGTVADAGAGLLSTENDRGLSEASAATAPENETDEQRTTREAVERDQRGRFAPKKADATAPADANAAPAPKDPNAPADTTGATPPSSWGVKAKSAWANLPQEVRAEIGKREGEVANGLRALADYKDLAPYADMARQHGVTIKQSLDHYLGIDKLLQQDIHGGLAVCAEAYGYKTKEQLGQLFGALAQRYGATVPTGGAPTPTPGGGQPAANEDDALRQIMAPVLKPLMDEIAFLKQHTSARVDADRNASEQTLAKAINEFAANPENLYFDNVQQDIALLFSSKRVPLTGNHVADLKAAYDLAVYMNPETRQALIEKQQTDKAATARRTEQEKADKARKASRSMGGSKLPGTLYVEKPAAGSGLDDIEADVAAAYRAHAS